MKKGLGNGRPISAVRLFSHLGFSEEDLQVPAAQDAVVLDVAREVHGAGAVHGAVDLHVAVDGVQVFLFVLEQRERHGV